MSIKVSLAPATENGQITVTLTATRDDLVDAAKSAIMLSEHHLRLCSCDGTETAERIVGDLAVQILAVLIGRAPDQPHGGSQ